MTPTVYGSDPFAYDFATALASANTDREASGRTLHPESCGRCPDCRETLADCVYLSAYGERLRERDPLADERAYWATLNIDAPSRDALALHVDKLTRGVPTAKTTETRQAVDQIASIYELRPERSPSVSKVQALDADGYTVSEIAKLTGKSERAVLAELRRGRQPSKARTVTGPKVQR